MPEHKPKYQSRIFRQYLEIDESDFQHHIRFYEEHLEAIKKLDFEEYYELHITYVNALFEVGGYKKHLQEVDSVIENSILRNIKYFKGEDIYRLMLFKKAASLYNLHRFEEADYVLRELIKIDPFDKDPVLFLKKCLRKHHSSLKRRIWAISILCFLLTAAIIALEILWIRPFKSEYQTMVEIIRFVTFISGIFILFFGNLYHRMRIEKEVNEFVSIIQQQKLKEP